MSWRLEPSGSTLLTAVHPSQFGPNGYREFESSASAKTPSGDTLSAAIGLPRPRNSAVSGGRLCTLASAGSSKSLSDVRLSLRLFTWAIRYPFGKPRSGQKVRPPRISGRFRIFLPSTGKLDHTIWNGTTEGAVGGAAVSRGCRFKPGARFAASCTLVPLSSERLS
jgi:hypothetical protein